MKRPPVWLLLAALLAGFLAWPAGAATPLVGVFDTADAQTGLTGADHATYSIGVHLRVSTPASSATFAYVTLSVSKCSAYHCGTAVAYTRSLSSSAYTFANDASAASLTISAFGQPLTVHWSSSQTNPSNNTDLRVPGSALVQFYRTATAAITVLGVTCNNPSAQIAVNAEAATAGGADQTSGTSIPASAPKALRAHGRYRPRCAPTA
jgi:hypothetical protein